MNAQKFITGIVPTEKSSIVFFVEEHKYDFCFMTDTVYNHVSPRSNPLISLKPKDNFLYGKTHDNSNIAIYTNNNSLDFTTTCNLDTDAYIVSRRNWENENEISEYTTIRFKGKILKSVFEYNAFNEINLGISSAQDKIISCHYTMNEENIKITIKPVPFSSKGNNTLIKNEVYLELEFENPQPLKTIFLHYENMKKLLSFMTYRLDTGFDEITLLKYCAQTCEYQEIAQVYIKDNINFPKEAPYALTFQDLGENLAKLLNIIYSSSKECTYSFDFLPNGNDEIYNMDNARIRMLCSALEIELRLGEDISPSENQLLDELIKQTKKHIKDFRASHNSDVNLGDKTYRLIFGDIDHWTLALADKLCMLYSKYKNEVVTLKITNNIPSEEDICNFVKYRNNITHGSKNDNNITSTALKLMGLVYCCFLTRIGMDRAKVFELCCDKLFRY